MDAKAAARAELIREREAGLWHSEGEEFSGSGDGDQTDGSLSGGARSSSGSERGREDDSE
jgi:GTP-binding protein